MKYGKSLLLGELINAKEVDYEDVRKNRFWIVCPVCNEAIFKVVRPTDNGNHDNQTLHFFSHYEASRSYASDCELRVGRLSEDYLHAVTIESREQKLKYFIATLQDAIQQQFADAGSETQRFGDRHFRQLRRSGTFAWYRDSHYRVFARRFRRMSDEEILASLDFSIQTLGEDEREHLTTNLSINTQKRIALDLLKHLAGAQGRPAYDYLFDHAYTWLIIRLQTNIDVDRVTGFEKDILPVLNRLPNTSRHKAHLMMADLARTNHSKIFGTRYDGLDTLTLLLSTEALVILVSLPYLDILRQSFE